MCVFISSLCNYQWYCVQKLTRRIRRKPAWFSSRTDFVRMQFNYLMLLQNATRSAIPAGVRIVAGWSPNSEWIPKSTKTMTYAPVSLKTGQVSFLHKRQIINVYKCFDTKFKNPAGARVLLFEKRFGQLWLPSFQHDMLRLSDSSFHPFFHRPTWQLLPGHCSVSRWRMSTPADGANCFNLLQWTERSEWPI